MTRPNVVPEAIVLADASRGRYQWQHFAEHVYDESAGWSGANADDLRDLRAGPDDELYGESADNVQGDAELRDHGVRYLLDVGEGGDLLAVPHEFANGDPIPSDPSVREHIVALRDGAPEYRAFAWPGGYPVVYLTGSGDTLCAECVATWADEVTAVTVAEEPGAFGYCEHCAREHFADPDEDEDEGEDDEGGEECAVCGDGEPGPEGMCAVCADAADTARVPYGEL